MSILKTAALSSLIMAAALAGCSSSNYGPSSADQISSTAYWPHNEDFTPNYRASTSIGSVMTTREGMTVYTFDKDQLDKSTCYADCAQKWPPVIASDGAQRYGRMSLASRDDGQWQWTYDGKPLYTFAEDRMHGDIKGENAGNDWHVVR